MFTGFGNTIGWVFSKEFRTLVKNKEIVMPGLQYVQVLIFSLLALAIPTVGIVAAYQAGVHEFFDPQTYSVVTAYAPYGKQVAAMVFFHPVILARVFGGVCWVVPRPSCRGLDGLLTSLVCSGVMWYYLLLVLLRFWCVVRQYSQSI